MKFWIGIALMAAGIIWAGIVSGGSMVTEDFVQGVAQTSSLEVVLDGDAAFYKVSLPESGDSVFVQILDPDRNIVADKKIQTRLAVNYFDTIQAGSYEIKVTNISDRSLPVQIQVGQIDADKLAYPGAVLGAGILLSVAAAYIGMKNYRMAQPDENTS